MAKLTGFQKGFLIFTIVVIIGLIVANVIMYIKRSGIYTFKAIPAPSGTSTKGGLFAPKAATTYNNVYYPNGEPDPDTGLPADFKPLPGGVSKTLTNNLNLYAASGSLQNANEWGPNSSNA